MSGSRWVAGERWVLRSERWQPSAAGTLVLSRSGMKSHWRTVSRGLVWPGHLSSRTPCAMCVGDHMGQRWQGDQRGVPVAWCRAGGVGMARRGWTQHIGNRDDQLHLEQFVFSPILMMKERRQI